MKPSPAIPQPSPHRFGWVADLPDHRDHIYAAPAKAMLRLAPSADLRPLLPPVYDQGQIGSCTANAVAAAMQFTRKLEGHAPDFAPSRLFIYWNERNLEHTVPIDNGAQLRDGIKVANKFGVCPETDWPYDATPADQPSNLWPAGAKAAQKPPAQCYATALGYQSTAYLRLAQTLPQMKGCLASGYPFVFGFTAYQSFLSGAVAASGEVPMPAANEPMAGGHAVLAVGYNEQYKIFIARNSWGPGWGKQGYFTIPYAYLLDPTLSSDCWTIRVVE